MWRTPGKKFSDSIVAAYKDYTDAVWVPDVYNILTE